MLTNILRDLKLLHPIAGGGLFVSSYFMGRLNELPVWALHEKKDDLVSHEESLLMVEGINEAGGIVNLNTYDQGKHDGLTEAYSNDELFKQLLQHPKKQAWRQILVTTFSNNVFICRRAVTRIEILLT